MKLKCLLRPQPLPSPSRVGAVRTRCEFTLLLHRRSSRFRLGAAGSWDENLRASYEEVEASYDEVEASVKKNAAPDFQQRRKRREAESKQRKAPAAAQKAASYSKSSKSSNRNKYEKDLTLSLLLPFGEGGLPPRGKTQHLKEEECDPWTQNCKTEAHVWESKCERCFGTGNVISGFNGHYSRRRARRHGSGSIRMMSTCVKCTGTGWVRHSSAREVPSPFPNGNPQSPNLAIARKSMFSFDFDEEDGNEGSQQT